MTGTRKLLLYIEALVCFGPAAFTLLLGTLLYPVWVGIFFTWSFGLVDLGPDERMPQAVLWPITLYISGVLGLVGLGRVLWLLSVGRLTAKWRRLTLALVLLGIGGILGFNFTGGPTDPIEEPIQFLAFFALPTLGSAHLLWLARPWLFANEKDLARRAAT